MFSEMIYGDMMIQYRLAVREMRSIALRLVQNNMITQRTYEMLRYDIQDDDPEGCFQDLHKEITPFDNFRLIRNWHERLARGNRIFKPATDPIWGVLHPSLAKALRKVAYYVMLHYRYVDQNPLPDHLIGLSFDWEIGAFTADYAENVPPLFGDGYYGQQ